jgi:energy-coupling factor transporter ATP-binding protein EcfA2
MDVYCCVEQLSDKKTPTSWVGDSAYKFLVAGAELNLQHKDFHSSRHAWATDIPIWATKVLSSLMIDEQIFTYPSNVLLHVAAVPALRRKTKNPCAFSKSKHNWEIDIEKFPAKMKIHSLQISNILSFAHYDNILDAPGVKFEEGLNILIGQNGAGKSTVLEVINFVFKRVVLAEFQRDQDLYERRSSVHQQDVRQVITRRNDPQAVTYGGFRLEPNWNSPDKPQRIIVQIALDDIDAANMEILRVHASKLGRVAGLYSTEGITEEITSPSEEIITIEITLNRTNNSFSASFSPNEANPAVQYLVKYNLFRELIDFHNIENQDDLIPPLFESFSLIGS